jgi:hypothetical protein
VYNILNNGEFCSIGKAMTLSKAQKEREEFLGGMARLIKFYESWFETIGGQDLLPEGYELQDNEKFETGVPSLGQIVAVLNDNRHGTRYNKKWTRHSLKILLEELKTKGVKTNVGHKKCKTSRANIQRTRNADIKAMETYEKYLKDINIEHMTNSELARQLNKCGSKTIKGNEWSPAGCGHLRKRLERKGILVENYAVPVKP